MRFPKGKISGRIQLHPLDPVYLIYPQLVSQNVIPHKKYFGGSLPYAFTEQGVAMLSSVLNSERAIKVNIEIMRAFVRLRQILAFHAGLARKLDALDPTPVTHVIIGEGSVFGFAERGMIDEITLARTMVWKLISKVRDRL